MAKNMPSTEVIIAGRHQNKAEERATAIYRENVTGIRLDAHNYHGCARASGSKRNSGGIKKNATFYHLLDRYDQIHGVTAMARTTAYPASILARLIAQEEAMEEKGVIPLEKLGIEEKFFNKMRAELEKRQVKIVESLH